MDSNIVEAISLTEEDLNQMIEFLDEPITANDGQNLFNGTNLLQPNGIVDPQGNAFNFDGPAFSIPLGGGTPLSSPMSATTPSINWGNPITPTSQSTPINVKSESYPSRKRHAPNPPMDTGSDPFDSSALPELPILSPKTTEFPPEPQTPKEEPSTVLINQVQQYYIAQQDQLQQLRLYQKQVLLNPQPENIEQLVQQHNQLKQQIDQELKALSDLEKSFVLAPNELHKLFYLMQNLEAQNLQLELYHQELEQLVLKPNPNARCFAILTITEQPFPLIITQNKTKALEEPVTVQLMTGASVSVQSISEVKAIIHMNNTQAKNSTTKPLEDDVERLDDFQKTCKFHLKFMAGTRKDIATLKFQVQITLSDGTRLQLESNPSNPFIVITNECQFEESNGTLLKCDAFGQGTQIPWPQFANRFQRHVLKATRQDPIKPQRFLSRHELSYLNAKFFDATTAITAKQYDDFWNWFGKGLQKIRYGRHMGAMWQNGLIYGFIERDGVNAALINQQPGTFLIRLSERHPGEFAIGYVIDDIDPSKRVRHYLVRPEDLFSGKKSLPEFIMECPQFSRFLQVNFDLNGTPRHRILGRDQALEPYGIKRNVPDAPKNGYDGSLVGKS